MENAFCPEESSPPLCKGRASGQTAERNRESLPLGLVTARTPARCAPARCAPPGPGEPRAALEDGS